MASLKSSRENAQQPYSSLTIPGHPALESHEISAERLSPHTPAQVKELFSSPSSIKTLPGFFQLVSLRISSGFSAAKAINVV